VKYFETKYYIEREQSMIRLINGFKHLSNAYFYSGYSSNLGEFRDYQNANTIMQHSRRLTPNCFQISFVFSRRHIYKKNIGDQDEDIIGIDFNTFFIVSQS
jgi:hypothetical protein